MLAPEDIHSHARKLQAYAQRRVSDSALAEDLVQDTFVAALASQSNGASGFRGDSSVYTWLTGILKRKIIDHYRSRSHQAVSLDALQDTDGEGATPLVAELEDTARGPEGQLADKRFVEEVQRRLARMPERTARAFVMAEIAGHDSSEICAELGITKSNLWVLLHRARRELQASLGLAGHATMRTA